MTTDEEHELRQRLANLENQPQPIGSFGTAFIVLALALFAAYQLMPVSEGLAAGFLALIGIGLIIYSYRK